MWEEVGDSHAHTLAIDTKNQPPKLKGRPRSSPNHNSDKWLNFTHAPKALKISKYWSNRPRGLGIGNCGLVRSQLSARTTDKLVLHLCA